VQTHIRAFRDHLQSVGQPYLVVSPFDTYPALYLPLLALRRIVERFSPATAVRLYRAGHGWLLRTALRRRLRLHQDAVVAAQCPVSAQAALTSRTHARQRVTLVVHFNESQADEWVGKGALGEDSAAVQDIRAFEARVLAHVDRLVFVSAWMRDRIAARIPAVRGVPQAMIPNFVADPGDAMRAEKVPSRDLIAIGTLEPRKNQAYLLDIVAAAAKQGRRITLTIVGDGPDRASLEARSAALHIADRVVFAAAQTSASRLIPYHRAVIHVARIENLPLVLIESLAFGRPAFAAAVGGVPEIIEDGEHGRWLPLDDATAAAALVCKALEEPSEMARWGQAAQSRFVQHFERARVAEELRSWVLCGHQSKATTSSPQGEEQVCSAIDRQSA
jgi:glycosyltransferase involved in cell wall biosynthesis